MRTYDRTSKPCTLCKIVKPLTSFHRNRVVKDGRTSRCKECVAPRDWSKYAARRREINAQHEEFGRDPKYGNTWELLHLSFQTIERAGHEEQKR